MKPRGVDAGLDLTGKQVAAIRQSFSLLEGNLQTASEVLYRRLFEIAPELRPLFRSDILDQGMRFMSTLRVIVDDIDNTAALQPFLERLARGHAASGVKPEHFAPMGEALVGTMSEVLGEDMPEGAAEAWRAAYDRIAEQMIRFTE